MGILSGLVTGSIVFYINIGHGFLPALSGFTKQFIFNVFMAGFNTRTCEKLARTIKNTYSSLILASIIPTLQAFIILYSIHYFGGTPKPMASTIWQVPLNLIIFLCFALIYRQKISISDHTFQKILDFLKLENLIIVKKISGKLGMKNKN